MLIDNFAGGGGASLGIQMATGRTVDIAVNHDPRAVAMHKANHPTTRHYCEDVWTVDPLEATGGEKVELCWFSPDCTHFSKARGGKPVKKKIRGLAWIVLKWAKAVRPNVIILENVEEFQDWGPLTADNYPCKKRKGETFKRWCRYFKALGYELEHREIRACDFGTPTIRKRLFLIARCDGKPIVWPDATHGEGEGLEPYKTAADIIDWSIPCPSIFDRPKPLAEKTMARIAAGLQRYVLDDPNPFIIHLTHHGDRRPHTMHEPMPTVTGANRGELALITPYLDRQFGKSAGNAIDDPVGTVTAGGGGKTALIRPYLSTIGYGEREGQAPRVRDVTDPTTTVVAGGVKQAVVQPFLVGVGGRMGQSAPRSVKDPYHTTTSKADTALVMPFMAQHNTGVTGHPIDAPVSTLTGRATQQQIVTSHLIKLRGTCKDGQRVDEPMPTVTAGGFHVGEVRAFLVKYFGTAKAQSLKEPLHTITSKDRFGLVTVMGEEYQLVDIGMRMLTPRELFRAQGFPDNYQIEVLFQGKGLTKTDQTRLCGNSVCPQVVAALVKANVPHVSDVTDIQPAQMSLF